MVGGTCSGELAADSGGAFCAVGALVAGFAGDDGSVPAQVGDDDAFVDLGCGWSVENDAVVGGVEVEAVGGAAVQARVCVVGAFFEDLDGGCDGGADQAQAGGEVAGCVDDVAECCGDVGLTDGAAFAAGLLDDVVDSVGDVGGAGAGFSGNPVKAEDGGVDVGSVQVFDPGRGEVFELGALCWRECLAGTADEAEFVFEELFVFVGDDDEDDGGVGADFVGAVICAGQASVDGGDAHGEGVFFAGGADAGHAGFDFLGVAGEVAADEFSVVAGAAKRDFAGRVQAAENAAGAGICGPEAAVFLAESVVGLDVGAVDAGDSDAPVDAGGVEQFGEFLGEVCDGGVDDVHRAGFIE